MDKTIYHYDPDSGELLGSGPIYIGPAGDEQVVAFATLTPPPDAAEGYVAVVAPGSLTSDHACSWSLVRDWRSAELYRTVDGASVGTGASELEGWSGLGTLPAGVTAAARPSLSHVWSGEAWVFDLVAAKTAMLAAIEGQCAAELVAPFRVGDHSFNGDPVMVANILAAAQIGTIAKAAGRSYSTLLPTSDGMDVELDADGLVEVALALGAHQDTCRRMAKKLGDQIEVAQSEQELAAISWPTGEVP